MTDITERRAQFVYDAARLGAEAAQAPIIPIPYAEREQPFREQFLAVIERQCGPQRSTSPKELHGSWMQSYLAMGWVYGETYDREAKVHPDLVPYAELGQLERDKDTVFVALCEIARLYIYEAAEGTAEFSPSIPEGATLVLRDQADIDKIAELQAIIKRAYEAMDSCRTAVYYTQAIGISESLAE